MPAKSKEQFRLMQAITHGDRKIASKAKSLSPTEAAEFVQGQKNFKQLPKKVKKSGKANNKSKK